MTPLVAVLEQEYFRQVIGTEYELTIRRFLLAV
jgi:hypothetical protein